MMLWDSKYDKMVHSLFIDFLRRCRASGWIESPWRCPAILIEIVEAYIITGRSMGVLRRTSGEPKLPMTSPEKSLWCHPQDSWPSLARLWNGNAQSPHIAHSTSLSSMPLVNLARLWMLGTMRAWAKWHGTVSWFDAMFSFTFKKTFPPWPLSLWWASGAKSDLRYLAVHKTALDLPETSPLYRRKWGHCPWKAPSSFLGGLGFILDCCSQAAASRSPPSWNSLWFV